MIGEFNISNLFTYFDELWDRLLKERKRYAGQVRAIEVKSFVLDILPDFYSYLTYIARTAISKFISDTDESSINLPVPIADIKKHDIFRICVGEYMNINNRVPVYTYVRDKNAKDLMAWFDEGLGEGAEGNKYIFGDYSNLDFSDYKTTHTNFSFSQFYNSYFNNSSFHETKLRGANFHRAVLNNCNITKCLIYEADFSKASLVKANFANSQGNRRLSYSENSQQSQQLGLLHVNFCCSDLTDAYFGNANLAGADFSNAVLVRTDFTNAILTKADFTNATLIDINFTDANLDGAIFTGVTHSLV